MIRSVVSIYEHCGVVWAETWDCACNGRCPKCGTKDIEPAKSIEAQDLLDRLNGPQARRKRSLDA